MTTSSYGAVYVSGPMRGYEDYNFPAFYAAEQWLQLHDFGPIFNPARKDEEMGFKPAEDAVTPEFLQKAMRWDVEKVLLARTIVLLPGWTASEGAKMELAVARAIGVRVAELIYQDGKPSHLFFTAADALDNAMAEHERCVRERNIAERSVNESNSAETRVPLKYDYGKIAMSGTAADMLAADKKATSDFGTGNPGLPSEIRVVNDKTGGAKGTKQARFDLLPQGPLWEVAELYGRGAEKYEPRNWERGYDWSLSFAALMRHASLFWQGEDNDPETKKHHMASVAFHAFALIEFGRTHPELDDRTAA